MDLANPEPGREAVGRPKALKASGVVVPHAPRWHQLLVSWIIFALIKSVAATLRHRLSDRPDYFSRPEMPQAIYCLYHNRLALSMVAYYRHLRKRRRTPNLAVMVSASKDGGLLAAILERFKVQPVRGSTSRRGRQALLELTTWAERGYDLALTPDGPRGPCYVVQDGVMSLAQLTGLPIIPVSINVSSKIRAKSWDRFQVPLPFARCEFLLDKAIHVPREATDEQREALRQELERLMRGISAD